MELWSQSLKLLLMTVCISVVITFLLCKILKRFPRYQDQTPPFGGIAIYISFWLAIRLSFASLNTYQSLVTTFIASTCVLVTGIIDDWYELKPWQKSIGLLIAIHIVYFKGDVEFSSVLLPKLSQGYLEILVYILTIGWIYIVTNAFNLLDGVDGLASSVALTSLVTLAFSTFIFSVSIRLVFFTMLLVLAASILGFLPFNWAPAKIYLGDTGALFIGFMYATLTVTNLKNVGLFSMIMPIVLFSVPLFDTAFAIIRRLFSGRSPLEGDQDHIHHRLLRYGLTAPQTVGIMVLVTLVSSLFALGSYLYPLYRPLIMGVGLVSIIVISLYISRQNIKK